VDEDSQARAQLNVLRGDGHDVVAIGELDKNGTPDPEVFELAQLLERALLTHNTEDFHQLHQERPHHRPRRSLELTQFRSKFLTP
jgi:Domain of unknown function (DUF5615)